ncbi:MAG: aldehyde ferredoxin oxidoreductase family protein [Promethearchaeota archaeon]
MASLKLKKSIETSSGKLGGFMGKILWVNLSNSEIKEEDVPEEIYRKFLGGYGLGVYYIYTRIRPRCDPLGPDNIIGFCPGLLTGTPAPFTGRFMVCGKSPLTGKGNLIDGEISNGGWGDSNCGGYFGPSIKRAGYDAIFITGASEKPVYLLIDGDKKEIVDAAEYWGKDAIETESLLKDKYGKTARVVAIGLGGENRVLFSGIITDKGRIAARSGLGAVMGSKKLKAICIKANKKIPISDSELAIKYAKLYRKKLNKYLKNKLVKWILPKSSNFTSLIRTFKIHFKTFSSIKSIGVAIFSQFMNQYGTPFFTDICSDIGDSPIKNFKGTYKDYPKKKVGKVAFKNYLPYKIKSFGCFSCPIQCGAILKVPELNLEETHRPEYETIMALGGLLLNDDLNSIFQCNEFLNRQGIDSISAGGVLAFIYECAEQGLLKKEDFKCEEYPDGFLPKWGDSQYLLPLLKMIAKREGIGNILADGVKEASKKIEGSENFAIHSGGQELPMHDPRLYYGIGLNYVADPTPGRHTAGSGEFSRLGPVNAFMKGLKIKFSKEFYKIGRNNAYSTKFIQWFNALGFCAFAQWCGRYPVIQMLKAVVGWNLSLEELQEIGHRIQTLRQMFNAREGAILHEMSARAVGDPPMKQGPLKNRSLRVEEMTTAYYENIGFRVDGVPKEKTLKDLQLDFCLKDLVNAKGRAKPLINKYLGQ